MNKNVVTQLTARITSPILSRPSEKAIPSLCTSVTQICS